LIMKHDSRWMPLFLFLLASASSSLACRPPEEPEGETETIVSVQVGKVTRATLREVVEAYGRVEPEPAAGGVPAGAAELAAPAPGIVYEVPVREGQSIEAGTVVVRLDDRIAAAAKAKAESALEFAERQLERQKTLDAAGNTSARAMQEAEQQLASARAELADAEARVALVRLASPLAGVVTRIDVHPGQAVDASTVVAEVVDLARLVITVDVPAEEAARVRPGQPAAVIPAGASEEVAGGQVLYVSPVVDPSTATSIARISLPPGVEPHPGRFVRVRIVTAEHPDRLAVPVESVYTDHDGQSTVSIVEGGTARRRAVEVGLRDGALVEVEGEGLSEGATVVTVGSYALPEETRIRVVPSPGGAR